MVVSIQTRTRLTNTVVNNIPDEQMASQTYDQLAREMEQAANEALLPIVWRPASPYYDHPLNKGDYGSSSLLRGYAAQLRQIAADERRHQQILETMRTGLSLIKTAPI
jgi:hypothetical protein